MTKWELTDEQKSRLYAIGDKVIEAVKTMNQCLAMGEIEAAESAAQEVQDEAVNASALFIDWTTPTGSTDHG